MHRCSRVAAQRPISRSAELGGCSKPRAAGDGDGGKETSSGRARVALLGIGCPNRGSAMQAGSPNRVERRLAAILAADVVGYSRLMEHDEEGTARLLREHRAAADPLVADYAGRIVKTT